MAKRKKTPAERPGTSEVNELQQAYGAPLNTPIPLGVVRSLGEKYDMTVRDIADILEVTPKTLHRWSSERETLSTQQSDRITVLQGIFSLGEKVFRTQKNFIAWLREPVLDLGGKTPLEAVKTESGRREVETVLHRIEYGVY